MFESSQRTPRAIWWAAIIFCIIVITDSWFRWKTFQYQTFDLAFYVQGLWQMLRGQGHVSLLDVPIMGNHAEPIMFLMLPLFWIWKHPMMFVGVQALLLASMPFTAYRIATAMEFSARACLGLALAVLIAPAAGFGGLHEFHPETLAAPFILLLLEARLRKQSRLHFVWFMLAVMCKENVAGMLAWLCALHFLLERERGREWQITVNILPGAIALCWVLAYAFWLGPKWNGGNVDYAGLYGHLRGEDGSWQIGGAFRAVWHGLTNGNLVWLLLLPFIFLPVLRPRWIIIAAPIFVQHLLSSRSSEWQIYWHYGLPLLPLMWYAAVEAASRLFWRDSVAAYIVGVSIVVQLWDGPVRSVARTISDGGLAWDASRVHASLVTEVAPDARVTASYGFLSHVAKREHLQSLHLVIKGARTLGGGRYTPKPSDHVLVDFADQFTFDQGAGLFHPQMKITKTGEVVPSSHTLLHTWMRENTLWPTKQRAACALYSRTEPVRTTAAGGIPRRLDDKTQLVSIIPQSSPNGDLLAWQITWNLAGDRTSLLWTKLMLRGEGNSVHYIVKGPALPGTELGQFTETWTVPPPAIEPGKYKAVLIIYDPLVGDSKTGFIPLGLEFGALDVR